ncbi:hypothetical protein [Synechococcus sp. UW140]|uniref:hypothetical protein n=1 Tax=Synechococcus sp. UW140 TaxID=368503 RepID=UPI0010BD230A|nr:hypothetical protein [Synechococcus sp. UW140]
MTQQQSEEQLSEELSQEELKKLSGGAAHNLGGDKKINKFGGRNVALLSGAASVSIQGTL